MIEVYNIVEKLDVSLKSLQLDKAALQAADSPEELAETNNLIKDVEDARNLIVARAAERRNTKERRQKWEALLPQCSAAKEEYEAAVRAVKLHSDATFEMEDALARARRRLDAHIIARPEPSSYPTAKTVRSWNLEKTQLERDVEKRQKELVGLKEREKDIAAAFQTAKQKFEQLAWQERQLRPAAPAPKVVPVAWTVERGPALAGVSDNPFRS